MSDDKDCSKLRCSTKMTVTYELGTTAVRQDYWRHNVNGRTEAIINFLRVRRK